jgi:SAM-dependent methyltransferase
VSTRDTIFFVAGLAFLVLAKAKNVLRGYSTPKPFDISQTEPCVSYDLQVVDKWLGHLGQYLNVDGEAALHGMDVLELGPGSDLGIGLYLLYKGARTYSACDVNGLAAAVPDEFYEALFAKLPSGSQETVLQLRKDLIRTNNGIPSRLNYVVRADFDLASAFAEHTVDLVFSQAAFEHFDDIDATVNGLSKICRPGAVLVAEIDLQTHSRWIRDHDPNNIYRYPEWLYRALWFRGAPNRIRPLQYVRALERNGWTDIAVLPLSTLEDHDASALYAAFRDNSNEMNLLSVVLCARKPGSVHERRLAPFADQFLV